MAPQTTHFFNWGGGMPPWTRPCLSMMSTNLHDEHDVPNIKIRIGRFFN